MWLDKYRGPPDRTRWAAEVSHAVVHKIKGRLLLISGDMDESVPVSHTLTLADALIRASKDFDLLIVPNAGHDVLMTHGYAQRRAWDHFVRHLLGATPPSNFEIRFELHEQARFAKSSMREARQ
jgi:dipeptidyl aminopeptidase/acylaminoacyl peptidase